MSACICVYIATSTVLPSLIFVITQVGNGTGSPYKFPDLTATYIANWIIGAKKTYGLDIDYVGVSIGAVGLSYVHIGTLCILADLE